MSSAAAADDDVDDHDDQVIGGTTTATDAACIPVGMLPDGQSQDRRRLRAMHHQRRGEEQLCRESLHFILLCNFRFFEFLP